jgi:hypothetical protein
MRAPGVEGTRILTHDDPAVLGGADAGSLVDWGSFVLVSVCVCHDLFLPKLSAVGLAASVGSDEWLAGRRGAELLPGAV